MNNLVVPLALETAIWYQVFWATLPPLTTLEPLLWYSTAVPFNLNVGATWGSAVLRSTKFCTPDTVAGRIQSSIVKSPVPNPNSVDVATEI